MTAIGQRIKQARKNKKFSQTSLAEIIGVTQPTIGNWESGHHEPRHAVISRIAEALDVRRLWLMSGMEAPEDGKPLAPPVLIEPNPYLTTPIVHVAVLDWPHKASDLKKKRSIPHRHLAASLWALQPFALVVQDEAMANEFPNGSIVVFDAARAKLYDGEFYLFEWNGSALLRRYRNNPCRLEPTADSSQFDTLFPEQEPIVIARALQVVRDLA